MLKIYLNLILNSLSNVRVYDRFSIIHKVKRIKQTTDDIRPNIYFSFKVSLYALPLLDTIAV